MNTKTKEAGARMANTAFDWLAKLNALILPIFLVAIIGWGANQDARDQLQETTMQLNQQSVNSLIKALDSMALTVDRHIHKPGHAVNQQRLETIESTLDRIETSVNSINKKMP